MELLSTIINAINYLNKKKLPGMKQRNIARGVRGNLPQHMTNLQIVFLKQTLVHQKPGLEATGTMLVMKQAGDGLIKNGALNHGYTRIGHQGNLKTRRLW